MDVANFIVVLFYKIATAPEPSSNHHSNQSTAINIETKPFTSKTVVLWGAAFEMESHPVA